MHDAYDKDLRLLLHQCAEEMKIQSKLREGVYCMIVGPTFATPAEMKLLLSLGGDVVGKNVKFFWLVICKSAFINVVFAMFGTLIQVVI